jgi:hypothetical protein
MPAIINPAPAVMGSSIVDTTGIPLPSRSRSIPHNITPAGKTYLAATTKPVCHILDAAAEPIISLSCRA